MACPSGQKMRFHHLIFELRRSDSPSLERVSGSVSCDLTAASQCPAELFVERRFEALGRAGEGRSWWSRVRLVALLLPGSDACVVTRGRHPALHCDAL